jgi:crotonobetainyl-CoA:carnitine CoA-transferase CaiB-like acyl-CoA transferase
MAGPLHGVRVLDFGRYIAGPYCAALLAEFGADVIRIDKRGGSEDRFVGPVSSTGEGALYLQMNRNKRSLTLDPTSPEGREIVRRLVERADVVVANLPPATLVSMGLDYGSLSAINPRIILTTSSAYGPSGPMADYVGFDGVGQAMSGAVYMTGKPGEPYRAAVNWVDFGTALHCAFGTMGALMARQQTGRGQQVTGSLLGTALATTNSMLIEQATIRADRKPTGNLGQTAAPVNIYPTRDGFVLVQVVGQPLFHRWAKLVGQEAMLDDPRFADDDARGRNAGPIDEAMREWCAQRDTDEAVRILGEARIPSGPVLSAQQALDHPQVAALGLLQPTEFPGLRRPAPVAAAPVRLSESDTGIRSRAPVLGEHTDEILASVGYSAADIARLRAAGAI